MSLPRIVVLGASGLIGHAVALGLRRRGYPTSGIARRLAPGQRAVLGLQAREVSFVEFDVSGLAALMRDLAPGIVVNAVGVLQDGPGGTTEDVHRGFVERLIAALPEDCLLVHLSVPGSERTDATAFSRTKRVAEALVARSGRPHAILRPGFVVAPAAFGGSALVRALAALPVRLPPGETQAPFAATAIADIVDTIDAVARRWAAGEREFAECFDVMERGPGTLGTVIEVVRAHHGGPKPRVTLPDWVVEAGAWAGDVAAYLGWRPAIRSTALAELRRGVRGDPEPWSAATGLTPRSLVVALEEAPGTIQERWFARLYALKALVLASLVAFWMVSGLIALTLAYDAARAILLTRGFPPWTATFVTITSSLADIGIGALVAHRRTCRAGLWAGIGLSLFYMAGAAILTPDLWVEPLGALVKTGPAIVLMLVALAVLDDR
jgi:uncharacterized protein YbjT (DUF2867 family)